MKTNSRTPIFVTLDVESPHLCGTLWCDAIRGKEVFSFEYADSWLGSGRRFLLDPLLPLHRGPQYAQTSNFGIFLDSAPDRWGRFLIKRREALKARKEERPPRLLKETDYLLGVHDVYRMGALRFQKSTDGPFLDNDPHFSAPPWASLRDLEFASLAIEKENASEQSDYEKWLKMLIAPGGSLGGARPKASVVDEHGALWLAKFPGRTDASDVGAWEMVVHRLARQAGLCLPEARIGQFTSAHHTFMVKRFDRTEKGKRLFFMSAMTSLGRSDGDDASSGVSYLHLAELLQKYGSKPKEDLQELWSRMLFHVLISNTDDHLRNHGFLIDEQGWRLSPAYDLNANPDGEGLKLNISEDDNSQSQELILSVAKHFRFKNIQAEERYLEMKSVVRSWRTVAAEHGLSRSEMETMAPAFRLAQV